MYLKAKVEWHQQQEITEKAWTGQDYAVRTVVEVAERSIFLLHTGDDPSLKLNPETGNPRVWFFCGFHLPLNANANLLFHDTQTAQIKTAVIFILTISDKY
jgi:hypothetical protein